MRSKNPWLLLLRLAVFAGAVAFVLSQIDFADRTVLGEGGHTTVRAGLFTLFGRARLEWLALAFASFFLFTLAGIVRWWLLLETQGIRLRFFETLRLS